MEQYDDDNLELVQIRFSVWLVSCYAHIAIMVGTAQLSSIAVRTGT